MTIELTDEDREELASAIYSAYGESAIEPGAAAALLRKLKPVEEYHREWLGTSEAIKGYEAAVAGLINVL